VPHPRSWHSSVLQKIDIFILTAIPRWWKQFVSRTLRQLYQTTRCHLPLIALQWPIWERHIADEACEIAPYCTDHPRTFGQGRGSQHLNCFLRQGSESMRKVIEKQHDARHTNYPLSHLPLILWYSLSRQWRSLFISQSRIRQTSPSVGLIIWTQL
jgi:hypothetical protein